jgi:aminotransferase
VTRVFGARTGPAEVDAVRDSILNGWMGMGPRVAEFEAALTEHLGAPIVMVASGSDALLAVMTALDLPPGSDVIVPSFTWVACANAVVLAGHRPVFADVDVATQNVTAEHLAAVRTPKTAAVMVVHYGGLPVDLVPIEALGLPVIEDAAHATDSVDGERACGTLGAAGIYSFDAVKNLATPDGGAVTAPDPQLLERVRRLRYCGIGDAGHARASRDGGRWWELDGAGQAFPRMVPNDVSASIGLTQLARLADNQARRYAIWDFYQRELGGLAGLRTPQEPREGQRHSWFTYLVRVGGGRRDALAEHLLAHGVYTTLRYQPLHLTGMFGTPERSLPGCEQLAAEGLNLPLHPALTDAEVETVVDLVRGAL